MRQRAVLLLKDRAARNNLVTPKFMLYIISSRISNMKLCNEIYQKERLTFSSMYWGLARFYKSCPTFSQHFFFPADSKGDADKWLCGLNILYQEVMRAPTPAITERYADIFSLCET